VTGSLLVVLSVILFFQIRWSQFENMKNSLMASGAEINGTSLQTIEIIWPVDSKEFHAQQAPADASEAFRKAFAACAEGRRVHPNNGRVFIPPGYWWLPRLKMPLADCPAYGLGSQSRIDTVLDFSPAPPPAETRFLMKPEGGRCIAVDVSQSTLPFSLNCYAK